jgi:hypothetical protein
VTSMTPEQICVISVYLLLVWTFVVDPLLTGRFARRAKKSPYMRGYEQGVLTTLETIRTIAAWPRINEFDGTPAEVLLVVAGSVKRGFLQTAMEQLTPRAAELEGQAHD